MSDLGLSANMCVGRPARVVRAGLDDHLGRGALVVALQEAGGYLPIVRDLAREHGYRPPVAARANAGRGMNSSVLLVAASLHLVASGVALSLASWIGPRIGIRWPGRGIPWAVVDLPIGLSGRVERTLVASIHAPTGRLRENRRAWRRYLRRLRRLARRAELRHGATAILYLGDWNCGVDERDLLSVRTLLAKPLLLHVVDPGSKPDVDYAVTDLPLVGTTGPRHGSDHDSTRYDWKAA